MVIITGAICIGKTPTKALSIEDIQYGEKETLASINNVYQGPRTARYYF